MINYEMKAKDFFVSQGLEIKKTEEKSNILFASVGIDAISDRELTPCALKTFLYLCRSASNKGYCWPSQQTIADDIGGYKRNKVTDAIALLEKRKYIRTKSIRKENNQRKLVYAICYSPYLKVQYKPTQKVELESELTQKGLQAYPKRVVGLPKKRHKEDHSRGSCSSSNEETTTTKDVSNETGDQESIALETKDLALETKESIALETKDLALETKESIALETKESIALETKESIALETKDLALENKESIALETSIFDLYRREVNAKYIIQTADKTSMNAFEFLEELEMYMKYWSSFVGNTPETHSNIINLTDYERNHSAQIWVIINVWNKFQPYASRKHEAYQKALRVEKMEKIEESIDIAWYEFTEEKSFSYIEEKYKTKLMDIYNIRESQCIELLRFSYERCNELSGYFVQQAILILEDSIKTEENSVFMMSEQIINEVANYCKPEPEKVDNSSEIEELSEKIEETKRQINDLSDPDDDFEKRLLKEILENMKQDLREIA